MFGLGKKRGKKESHPHLTKGYIFTKIPIAKKENLIKDVLAVLVKESNKYDTVDNVYIVDDFDALVGVVSIRELFNNPVTTQLSKIMKTNLITATPDMDVEKVADLALKHDLKAIPVIEDGKLAGAITSRKVISIVNHALKEDIFHFAGIHRSHLEFENSLEVPVKRAISSRLPWLLMGLLGSILIAYFINFFEETLAQHIIIAAFIPAIVYMSGALSSQVLMIFIRDMAVGGKSFNLRKYFFKETFISLLLALSIVAAMYVMVAFFWREPYLAFVIALATFLSIIATTLIAILIAVMIKRFKFDPALGSGPIATVISDISSVIIYFWVVLAFI